MKNLDTASVDESSLVDDWNVLFPEINDSDFLNGMDPSLRPLETIIFKQEEGEITLKSNELTRGLQIMEIVLWITKQLQIGKKVKLVRGYLLDSDDKDVVSPLSHTTISDIMPDFTFIGSDYGESGKSPRSLIDFLSVQNLYYVSLTPIPQQPLDSHQ